MVKAAEVGIAPWEFWKMTWKDFLVMIVASERKEVNEWRKFRFLGYMAYLSSTGDRVKKTIEQFMPLPFDPKPDRGKVLSNDEVKNALRLYGIGNKN